MQIKLKSDRNRLEKLLVRFKGMTLYHSALGRSKRTVTSHQSVGLGECGVD